MTNIKLVLVDFDDTLCLTEENGFHLENEVAMALGYKPQSRNIHQSTWGKPLPEVAATRFPGIDIDIFMDSVGKAMAEKASRQEFDVISPQNLKTISLLKSNNYLVGIVTSRIQKEISHLISKNHPLMTVLGPEDIFYKEKTIFGKPDPKVFDIPLNYYSVLPQNTVYVGDSITDAIASKKAGMGSIISIESNLRAPKEFPAHLVDLFVSNFCEIPNSIKNIKVEKLKLSNVDVDNMVTQKTMSVPHDLLNN